MDAHQQMGSIPIYSTNMFFETTICYFICEVIVGGWLASVGLEQGKRASTCRPRDAGSRWNNFYLNNFRGYSLSD